MASRPLAKDFMAFNTRETFRAQNGHLREADEGLNIVVVDEQRVLGDWSSRRRRRGRALPDVPGQRRLPHIRYTSRAFHYSLDRLSETVVIGNTCIASIDSSSRIPSPQLSFRALRAS